MIPNSRPKLSKADAEKILLAKGCSLNQVNVLAVRGYYLDSMGVEGKNDRGIFDDAAFVCSPTAFVAVNWNTDPSSYRRGRGTGSAKGMASLKLGVWDYKIGAHKGVSPACREAGPVTVIRDGVNGDYEDTDNPPETEFAINHHWGSNSGTSSAGCQTAPPNQWPSYINTLVSELKRYGQKTFKYVLIDVKEMQSLVKGPQKPVEHEDYQKAYDLLVEFEGLYLKAYKDPVGVVTIGYGTIEYPDGSKVQMGDSCSKEEAIDWMIYECLKKAEVMHSLIKVPVSNEQFCALLSFCYNLGTGALAKSTLLRLLNDGESQEIVAEQFLRYVKAGGRVFNGLVRRRKAEKALFLS